MMSAGKGGVRGRGAARAIRAIFFLLWVCVPAAFFAGPAWAQKGCDWYGTPPLCDGQCPQGHVYTGKRQACATGSRRFCCPAHYVVPGVNCKWVGEPGRMLYVCDDPMLKFYLKNACNVPISVQVQYKPINRANFVTNNYRFAPGETGYLVDTKNRYIYVTAQEVGGNRTWPRHRVDMGDKLGHRHTHTINCR